MAKYDKILRWAGPIILPVVIAAIRSIWKKRRAQQAMDQGEDVEPQRDLIDTLVDAGLAGLSRGRGKGRGQ